MGVELAIGLGLCLVLLCTGFPIFVVFCLIGGLLMLVSLGFPLESLAHMFFSNVDSSNLLAIPFFVLAGSFMTVGGVSKRLIALANSCVGHLPGGMTTTVVLVTTFFGAICGSHVAALVAIGSMMIPEMEKLGYKRSFTAALICNITCTSMLIPPSLGAILYGFATQMSIGKLFMAGLIPGLFMAVIMGSVAMYISWRRGYGRIPKASWAERGRLLWGSIPALLMPVFIHGSIYSGVVTCTEAAAVAAVYALFVGVFIYREIKLRDLTKTLMDSAKTVGNLFFLVTSATILGKVLVFFQMPQMISDMVMTHGVGKIGFCFLAIVLLFILGTFMEASPMMLCTIPILWPSIQLLGVDPYMFYILMTCMVGVAQISPPEGVALFVMSDVAKVPALTLFRESIVYMVLLMVVAIICVFFPQLASWIPSMM
ncbi:MAG: TRAP transporter large permease [Syntrophaceae bacterium]|nr:TRAP transporter large permease [Syntrophaceae bacterium]